MHFTPREWLKSLGRSLAIPVPEAARQLRRLEVVERDIVLPIKLAVIAILFYAFQASHWFGDMSNTLDLVVDYVDYSLGIYAGVNLAGALILCFTARLPLRIVQWSVFAVSLVDGVFLSALVLVTGGYDSVLYWLFVGLILRNAASLPPTIMQMVLNLSIALCYVVAGVMDVAVSEDVARTLSQATREDLNVGWNEHPAEPLLLRLFVLVLMGVSSFGVQVLLEKQRLAQDEARDFSIREAQLRAAGRLAAEIAHQIKNPLAIINNTIYSLRRSCGAKPEVARQIEIIQEEVDRSDQIITQIMGYAQLADGHVEKLDVAVELDRAIAEVFPVGGGFTTNVNRDYDRLLPAVVMQRVHLSQILVNLLLNAREATGGRGNVWISAVSRPDNSVEIVLRDDGPGIPPDKLARVFEVYYTTKEKGTGLGLSIVKHNVDLYGGSVRVESALGNGATFTLLFPAVTPIETHNVA
jgi:signal transduction histidine kinase